MALALKNMWTFGRVNTQYPLAKYVCAGVSGYSLVYALYAQFQKSQRENEIEFRKQQLSKPVYELRDEELVSPPWNSTNLHEWLYRPIRITGRPLHYKQMQVARTEFKKPGFETIVPLVTRENANHTEQEGQLLSLGFVPYEYKDIADRFKLEDASVQVFEGFVSQLSELSEINGGNVPNERCATWNYVDLESMAQFTGFKNAKKIGKVVIENADLNTPLDERNMKTYNLDADHNIDYPYLKTRSGALYHSGHMPWDWQKAREKALGSTVVFGTVGLLLHLAK